MSNDVQEKRIHDVEVDVDKIRLDLNSVQHVLTNQEKILQEMKDVLVSQTKTIQDVVQINKDMISLTSRIDKLENVFETRKENTDIKHSEFGAFMSKVKGGLIVGVFSFGIIQGLLYNEYSHIKDQMKEFKNEIRSYVSQKS